MQTTLRLDDELYRQAKARAAMLGVSLTKFLEEAIRERLHAPMAEPPRQRIRLPVSSAAGGLAAGFSTLEDAVAAADLAEDRLRVR
ncbi:MAG TPA: ribbon-helix-helix protein, CopG family [Thermoanaerobaculia bacterium]|nr:ribbon-helix-helix protein, CopG family [Thermoanaerobaculia bacterium]